MILFILVFYNGVKFVFLLAFHVTLPNDETFSMYLQPIQVFYNTCISSGDDNSSNYMMLFDNLAFPLQAPSKSWRRRKSRRGYLTRSGIEPLLGRQMYRFLSPFQPVAEKGVDQTAFDDQRRQILEEQ